MADGTYLKIALFHLGFFYSGGGEKLILEEMRALRKMGHEVDCYAPFVDRDACFPDSPEMTDIRTLLPSPPSWLPASDPLWIALSCLLIPILAWRFRSYDVVLGANQPGPWFAFIVGKILQKPYVIYLAQPLRILHPRDVDKENGIKIRSEADRLFLGLLAGLAGRLIDRADRASVQSASAVLTNGEHVSKWISRVYGVPNEICSAGCHPVPKDSLNYQSRWKGSLSIDGKMLRKPFILLTNRHSPQKRFEYALWALKSVRRDVPSISLVVTGQETEYTEQLRYLAEGLGLKEAVHFVGLVPEAELELLYQAAALYVYPSPDEDFGMGIVEAMAAGTPVVAWNKGGPTGIVKNHQTGYLAKPNDTEDFAEKIQILATSPDIAERMGRAGHDHAVQQFSYSNHALILESALIRAATPIEDETYFSEVLKPVEAVSVEANNQRVVPFDQ